MRLDKFLSEMEIGTRSQVKEYIKKGLVEVNNIIIKKSDYKIDENNDSIIFNGKSISYQKYKYYMLNKPAGVVSATKDNFDKTVLDLLSNESGKNLFPVGRLDKDTEGLLIITNDGDLSHNLLSPKKHIDKTYYVECSGHIDAHKIDILETGVDIGDDKPTKPAKVNLLSSNDTKYLMYLTITEGRFHQVKRMVEAIDGHVTYLKRISMGTLKLDDSLPKGSYRELTSEEISMLKK
ncbi:MAG: rRNA pseudouridine synthase [Lachnospiraceae bacterium]|nr:rRNA pseudouridine synthase [Lachnospiraceae bacterium]MEE0919225.1 pseudouridine synthase [Lachnospiraceae bacterium]